MFNTWSVHLSYRVSNVAYQQYKTIERNFMRDSKFFDTRPLETSVRDISQSAQKLYFETCPNYERAIASGDNVDNSRCKALADLAKTAVVTEQAFGLRN
jgi:hypothetical protein